MMSGYLMSGYPDWEINRAARVSVDIAQEEINLPAGDVIHVATTGRVRIVIEGEKDLVYALLGRNFQERCKRTMESIGNGVK